MSLVSVDLKKWTLWKLWVNFSLGQDEDYTLGDSALDSPEKLLQRGRGEGEYICDFGKEGSTCNQACIFPDFC